MTYLKKIKAENMPKENNDINNSRFIIIFSYVSLFLFVSIHSIKLHDQSVYWLPPLSLQ